jgi:hypothetical protein
MSVTSHNQCQAQKNEKDSPAKHFPAGDFM